MEKKAKRIRSIDLLRGLVMIIMALDHVRDYFHNDAMLHDPMDLQTTTPFLFLTRWITHYCAPVFVFLSGVSAYLSGLRKSRKDLSGFLIRRGLWLVLIEITIVGFGWTFNPFFNTLVLQVIWAIGISMIALGLFCWLPYPWILAIAITIVCGHNLLDYAEASHEGEFGFLWDALHHGGFSFHPFPFFPSHGALVIYPVLPWIGIMMLGFAFGRVFGPGFDASRRKRLLLLAGSGMLACFILLRLINLYGDPMPWQAQKNLGYTLMSFVHVSKYPPSLLFTCMTIGPALLFLAASEHVNSSLSRVITVFGQVPFFYYILHIYLIHLLTVIWFYISGHTSSDIVSPNSFFNFRPADMGFDLWAVYLIWLCVVAILYIPCRWYGRYKASHRHWWLSYI